MTRAKPQVRLATTVGRRIINQTYADQNEKKFQK